MERGRQRRQREKDRGRDGERERTQREKDRKREMERGREWRQREIAEITFFHYSCTDTQNL